MLSDFWLLQQVNGFFNSKNDEAEWLQTHREDPYWMAHQLNWAVSPEDYSNFKEYLMMAREIKGFEN